MAGTCRMLLLNFCVSKIICLHSPEQKGEAFSKVSIMRLVPQAFATKGVRIPLKEQVYNTSRQYTPQQYAAALVEQYSQQIKVLYRLGARKFALYGLGLLGCTPIAISVYGTNGARCVGKIKHCCNSFQ
ncbi:hypothetical protein QQP08_027517 [Theobroma cacao]|nr:hypothetical protein QQP08_027517 [Theobroma cacao]